MLISPNKLAGLPTYRHFDKLAGLSIAFQLVCVICDVPTDLLYHFDNIHDPNALAATWPRKVDWFAHPTPPPRQRGESYQSHLTEHWSRWDPSKKISLPEIVKAPRKDPRKVSEESDVKLPPVTTKDNVDFGRLMCLDYQREWLQNREEKEKLRKQKSKVGISALLDLVYIS